jgi:hypothetical protein
VIPKYNYRPVMHVKVHRDGREICNQNTAAGKREYRNRTLEMRRRQHNLCALCRLYLEEDETTFDHEVPGSAHRDDRITYIVDGVTKLKNFAMHKLCNGQKGSRRILHH